MKTLILLTVLSTSTHSATNPYMEIPPPILGEDIIIPSTDPCMEILPPTPNKGHKKVSKDLSPKLPTPPPINFTAGGDKPLPIGWLNDEEDK